MNTPKRFARGVNLAIILALGASGLAGSALAQPHGPPPEHPGDLPPGYQPGYAYGAPDFSPPDGYDRRYRRFDDSAAARNEDRRYGEAAQRWASDNCVDERDHDRAAGAVIGGVLGAIVGSNVAGRGHRTEGAVAGGVLGALAGSAIGASRDSPGCPPGYTVRRGAPPFAGPRFNGGYAYVAPPGYRPWIWNGGRWTYRPYPYHRYWYDHERRRGGYNRDRH